MKNKCIKCGKVKASNELILMPDENYICVSCWNILREEQELYSEKVNIKILNDGIPAILIPPNVLLTKEILVNGSQYVEKEECLEIYYYQIADNSKLSLNDVIELVEAKMSTFRDLITEKTALFMIANDLDIELSDDYLGI